MESIMTTKKCCFFCGAETGLEKHHVFGGPNRNLADRDGLFVYLCYHHHRGTDGVHGRDGNESRRRLMQAGQLAWMKHYNKTEDDFRQRYGKSVI